MFQKDQEQRKVNTDSLNRAKRPSIQPGAYYIYYILYEVKFMHTLKSNGFGSFLLQVIGFLTHDII